MTRFAKRTTPIDQKSPLEVYVEEANAYRRIFGNEEMEFPLSEKDVRSLFISIEGDLSPENLHCDGEISTAEANRRYNFLMKVLDELRLSDDWGVEHDFYI